MIKYFFHILINLFHIFILEQGELAHQRYIDNHNYYVNQSKFNLFQLYHMSKDQKK